MYAFISMHKVAKAVVITLLQFLH